MGITAIHLHGEDADHGTEVPSTLGGLKNFVEFCHGASGMEIHHDPQGTGVSPEDRRGKTSAWNNVSAPAFCG